MGAPGRLPGAAGPPRPAAGRESGEKRNCRAVMSAGESTSRGAGPSRPPGLGLSGGFSGRSLPGSAELRGCGLSPGSRRLSRPRGPGGRARLPARGGSDPGRPARGGGATVRAGGSRGSRFPGRGAAAGGRHVTAMRAAERGCRGGAAAAAPPPGRGVPGAGAARGGASPVPPRPALPSSPLP